MWKLERGMQMSVIEKPTAIGNLMLSPISNDMSLTEIDWNIWALSFLFIPLTK